jgi:plastocyanin
MKPLLTLAVALTVILTAPALAAAKRVTVNIEDLKFKPAEVTIQAGDTVVWVNNDDREHRVAADDGSFKSGPLASGKSYEHTFTAAGRVRYGDELYGRMHGTIVVEKK